MVGELTYYVQRPQYIPLTLEECMMCLIHQKDPIISSVALCDPQTETLIEELRKTGNGLGDLVEIGSPTTTSCHVQKKDDYISDTIVLSNCTGSGKIQSPIIEQWLSENFVEQEDASIARQEMYRYYCDCCQRNNESPCNQASFGKVVRIVFPCIKTRRLGVRGHSRYHYFGITPIHNEDRLFTSVPKRCQFKFVAATNGDTVLKKEKIVKPEGYSDIEPFLSGFPTVQNFPLRKKYKILANDFLEMYKDHAITLINSVVNADFDEVPVLLSEFWTCLPVRMFPLLNQPEFLMIVEQCDQALYFVFNDILVPKIPDFLNKRLSEKIIEFLGSIPDCLIHNLFLLPDFIRTQKLLVYKEFHRSMMTQLQINYLYTLTSVILHHPVLLKRFQADWEELDESDILGRVTALIPDIKKEELKFYLKKIQSIFNNCDNIPEQLLILVDSCLQQFWLSTDRKKPDMRNYLLYWSYVGSQIVQIMAELKSSQTGVFSLLEVLCKDYLMFKIGKQVEM